MRMVSFSVGGAERYGLYTEGGIIDGYTRFGSSFLTLRSTLQAVPRERWLTLAEDKPDFALAEVELLPPITDPGKVLCVGLNYRSHVAETGRDFPENPSLFLRLPDSLVGHGAALVKPRVSDHFDYEGELGVVIGRPGRSIALGDALAHIAGYACFNDGSIRDFQKHSVTAGKNFFASGGFGPWLVPAQEIEDPQALDLVTRVNGVEMQRSNTRHMIYSIANIISYISQFTPLAPGDVIATGTPEGVGSRRTPPAWVKAGDVVEVEIAGVGLLRNPVVAAK